MQDLSQLSLEQLQQLKQEKEQEKNQIYQELLRRQKIINAFNRGYYDGTEITRANSIEYKAEFYDLGIKYEVLAREIQEIDLLIAQYQNPSNPSDKDSSQDSNTESSTTPANPKIDSIYAPPPSKNLSSQKVLKSIESLQDFLKKLI